MTKLGSRQLGILKALDDHGEWSMRRHGSSLGPGWVWDTPSGTENTLETLVKRGLVRRVYVLTAEGEHILEKGEEVL